MKSKKLNVADGLPIARDHWDVPLRVELRPYILFCRRMDDELQQLVDQWAHTAAPNANANRIPRRKPR